MRIFIAMLLITVATHAQEFNKWSIEPEVGVTKLRDLQPIKFYNVDLGVRYMLNPLFGLKLSGNYTEIDEYTFQSTSLLGVANIGRVLKFESFLKPYTILAGLGGNYSYSSEDDFQQATHRVSNFQLAAFVDNEVKITNRFFLRAGIDFITGVNSRPATIYPDTKTTTVLNFNLGATFVLGKSGTEHADFYIAPPVNDTIYLKPTIIDSTKTIIQEVATTDSIAGNANINEHVFFKYDSFTFINGTQAFNAIKKIADQLTDGKSIRVSGYASPENGTGNPNYNRELALKRINLVVDYLLSLGVDSNQITIDNQGEIDTKDSNNIELSRRVDLIIE